MTQCPLLALSGHLCLQRTCPLSGVKRTCRFAPQMSAYDPKRTFPRSFTIPFNRYDNPEVGGHMQRREFITLLGGTAIAWPLAARAQQSEQMRRIGVLQGGGDTDDPTAAHIVRSRKRCSNWVGRRRNVKIDIRWPAADADKIRKYAAELVALAPDVILAMGPPPWIRCFRRHAPCRSCSWLSPIQPAPALSIVCRGRAATPLASCCSIIV